MVLRSEDPAERQMSASEEEFDLSDVNSVDFKLSSSLKYETEQESDGPSGHLSTSDEDDGAAFAEEPLADAEWTTEYERERKADEEMEKMTRGHCSSERVVRCS